MTEHTQQRMASRRGSILLFVLGMVFLASLALFRFIEQAQSTLMGEGYYIERDRLRVDAYSAMEVVLAVLADFKAVDGSLHHPRQGWGEPLEYAGISFDGDMQVEVIFSDESGKLPLRVVTPDQLERYFLETGFEPDVVNRLVEAFFEWTSESGRDVFGGIGQDAYRDADPPYSPPHEPVSTFGEFSSIQVFREVFFYDSGVPREVFGRFMQDVSLWSIGPVNLNAASPSVLRAWMGFGDSEITVIDDFRNRLGRIVGAGEPTYLTSMEPVEAMIGEIEERENLSTQVNLLRVTVKVTEGNGEFLLSAVLAPLDSPLMDQIEPPSPTSENINLILQEWPFRILHLEENHPRI